LDRCSKKDVDGCDKPGHDVDRIFTIIFGRLFTKVFDVTGACAASTCVYRACNAD
jgi:hypothetical protein